MQLNLQLDLPPILGLKYSGRFRPSTIFASGVLKMTSTKKDIVKEVAARTGFDLASVKDIVQTMFEAMCEGLARDGNIEIRNFGIFKVKSTPERKARNPKTSEIITVPAKRHISFKPGQLMKKRINDADYQEESDQLLSQGAADEISAVPIENEST